MTATSHTVLAQRGLLGFEGPDVRAFLQGQLTCDVGGLASDASTFGAYCTPKGRALATFLLWPAATGFLMQMPRALVAPLQKRLSMYILRSKVKANDATETYAQYGVAGDGAALLVERVIGSLPRGNQKLASSDRGTALQLPLNRYLVVVPRDRDAAGAILAQSSQPQPESWWDGLDIAAGIASVLPETQEEFVPQMLNLDATGGVSFSKGCYPGQEIVARMHYLGRLKERLFRASVRTSTSPKPGDKVYGVDLGTQAAGMVANVAPGGDGGYELLAVIRLSSVAAGSVRLNAVDGPELVLGELPYTLPRE